MAAICYVVLCCGCGQFFRGVAQPLCMRSKNILLETSQVSPVRWNWTTSIRLALVVWTVVCVIFILSIAFWLLRHIDMTQMLLVEKRPLMDILETVCTVEKWPENRQSLGIDLGSAEGDEVSEVWLQWGLTFKTALFWIDCHALFCTYVTDGTSTKCKHWLTTNPPFRRMTGWTDIRTSSCDLHTKVWEWLTPEIYNGEWISMYGSILWDLSYLSVERIRYAQQKGSYRALDRPIDASSKLLPGVSGTLPILDKLYARSLMFIQRCLSSAPLWVWSRNWPFFCCVWHLLSVMMLFCVARFHNNNNK